jgi:hypothetical protein
VLIRRKSQSVTEYAILLGLAIAAFAGMQLYVKRSLNARIKKAADVATGAAAGESINITGANGQTMNVTFGTQSQYEPYYTDSKRETYSEDVSREQVQNGQVRKEIVSNVQATKGGGYSAERTFNGSATSDAQWNTNTTGD